MQTVCQDTRAKMFLMQRLSVAMQRGNAACILGTIADDDFSTEFFVGLYRLGLIRPLYLVYRPIVCLLLDKLLFLDKKKFSFKNRPQKPLWRTVRPRGN